ncbi:proprotein convertase P-domain-containing protein [Cesiribacter sp. SM1]|uniref:proprotein convertase P-domain-containing protein n=1 Tax=Cesiribacter sp. SM1 TaxID=2861196 RepID=UPI001CD1BEC1|nr:proprotein convertase P-domain-containing protein [Cesiribacter sp. SM1]
MRKTFTLILFAWLLGLGAAVAQDISSYQLSGYTDTLTTMRGQMTELIGGGKSAVASEVQSIGFDFIFMGTVYNSYSVNANGVLRLGDEPVLPEANTYGITGNDRIVPFAGLAGGTWPFQFNHELATTAGGRIRSKVTGKVPNRVLTVEWYKMYAPAGDLTDFTFQLRLYESELQSANSGRIEFLYDPLSLRRGGGTQTQRYRAGFGVGPEQGNFVALDIPGKAISEELNYTSEVNENNNYFNSKNISSRLLYRFQSDRVPAGSFSNFALVCPAPNAVTIRFDENSANEAGIVVYRKRANQPDNQFKLIKSLPPDARSFSDGGAGPGQGYTYRFYLLGEGRYAASYTDFTTTPQAVIGRMAFQAINSGRWTNAAIWGGTMPGATDDVELGCAGSVFVTANSDTQIRDLTIQKGSFLTIEDGVTLSISGNFVNNGVFNPVGSGRLVLNGTEPQQITNKGRGITNDASFTAAANWVSWADNQTGRVAQKTVTVNGTDFVAIKSIRVNLEHTYLRDLTLRLKAPNGQVFLLAQSRGQRGRNYDNVVFTDTGKPLPPTVKNENLSGEYRPEESFSAYGGSLAGTWTLEVYDAFTGVGGRINGFEITLSKGGTNDLVMSRLTIDNSSSGGVTLNSGLVIQQQMQFIKGVVHASETAAVLFEAGAGTNGGSATSYIDGPAYKKGSTAFTFPLGNKGHWAPLGIENLQRANANTVFRAQYFKEGAPAPEALSPALDRVSKLEYWDLTPTAGNPTVDVVLHWKDAAVSDIVNITAGDLVVAHYTQNQWQIEGGEILPGSSLGAGGSGAIKAIGINTFSPFSFGSLTGMNPLPVQLLSFTGSPDQAGVLLQWQTASEKNNSHFEIQRSADTKTWQSIGRVEGNGTTSTQKNYRYFDREADKINYYRLMQVDFDGKTEYSPLVMVQLQEIQPWLMLYPNPTADGVTVKSSRYPADLVIWSGAGVAVVRTKVNTAETVIPLQHLPAGVYLLQLVSSQGSQQERLIITR